MAKIKKTDAKRLDALEGALSKLGKRGKLAVTDDLEPVFAITPLPRTIAMGSGTARCATTTPPAANTMLRVHNVTANANLAIVVENTGRCADVTIRLMRPGAAVPQIGVSPPAAAGHTTSAGPFAAQANDYVEVACGTGGTGANRCRFNYQINQTP